MFQEAEPFLFWDFPSAGAWQSENGTALFLKVKWYFSFSSS